MPATLPTPRTSIAAFNEANLLDGDDCCALETMAWKLKGAFKRDRSDSLAGLGLAIVYAMLGQRDDAVALTDELWGRRENLEVQTRLNLANLNADLGDYKRAEELCRINQRSLEPFLLAQRSRIMFEVHVALWGSETAHDLSSLPLGFPGGTNLLQLVSESGMLSVMEERQSLVREKFSQIQCGSDIDLGTDGDTSLMLTRLFYVPVSYQERRAISAELADALDDLYARHDIDQGLARGIMGEIVLPVAARPAGLRSGEAKIA